jgi:hypothetical protein
VPPHLAGYLLLPSFLNDVNNHKNGNRTGSGNKISFCAKEEVSQNSVFTNVYSNKKKYLEGPYESMNSSAFILNLQ